MTLRDTVKFILLRILDWARKNRDYFGALKTRYQLLYDEEKTFRRLQKEAADKAKLEKRGG